MEARHAVFLVVFGFSVIVGTNGHSCEFKECVDIMPPGIVYYTHEHVLPPWNRTHLEYVCSHLDEFFSCYDNYIKKCNDEWLREVKDVIARVYSYLCGKGHEPYLKIRDCLVSSTVRTEIISCTTKHDFRITTDEGENMKLSKCLKKAAEPCGEDSEKFFDGFTMEVASGSNNSGGQSHGMITAIVTALGLTIFMIAEF